MTRRRIIRAQADNSPPNPNNQRTIQKLEARRVKEQAALVRWQKKLTRAFNAVNRLQTSLRRIERQISTLENP